MSEFAPYAEAWLESPAVEYGFRGSLQIRIFEREIVPGIDETAIEWQWPQDKTLDQVSQDLKERLHTKRVFSRTKKLENELILTASPVGDVVYFENLDTYPAYFSALGYTYRETDMELDGAQSRRVNITSPREQRLNAFLSEVFPDGDSITYVPYAGNYYQAGSFFTGLFLRNEVPRSVRQPYRLHEAVGLHDFGFTALDSYACSQLGKIIMPHLQAYTASMGTSTSYQSDVPGFDAFAHIRNPLALNLDRLMENFDEFTESLAWHAIDSLDSADTTRLEREIEEDIEKLLVAKEVRRQPVELFADGGINKPKLAAHLGGRLRTINEYSKGLLLAA